MTALRRLLLLAFLGLGTAGPALRAQEPNPPAATTPTPAPDQDQSTEPGAATLGGNLFPGSGPSLGPDQQPLHNRPRPSRLLGNKSQRNARATDLISAAADADPLDVRIAYRRAKTLAMAQDPGLADLLRRAAAAPTDKAKREWLHQYYDRLFAAVRKIDPSPALKAHVRLLVIIARQRYAPQRRMIAGEEDLVNGSRGRR
jgi:hypothetical protein